MPLHEPDPGDPHELVGVGVTCGPEAMEEMAWVFAEEFARLGSDRDHMLWIFQNPFYAGAHRSYRELGHAQVATIIEQCLAVWGRVRLVDREGE